MAILLAIDVLALLQFGDFVFYRPLLFLLSASYF